MSAPVDVLAVALFAAYSRNSGNPPEAHFDRSAAEQWMALALTECGVAELIEAGERYRKAIAARDADTYGARKVYEEADIAQAVFDAALARVSGCVS